jgi:hypothetical protein
MDALLGEKEDKFGISSLELGGGSAARLANLVAAPHHIGQAAARVPPEFVEELLPVASHLNGGAGPHNLRPRGDVKTSACVRVCVCVTRLDFA